MIPIFGACTSLGVAFFTAVALAIIGNILGAWAWHYRAEDRSRWHPLLSQWYLFREKNFRPEGRKIRLAAVLTLAVGGALSLLVMVSVAMVLVPGASELCGVHF